MIYTFLDQRNDAIVSKPLEWNHPPTVGKGSECYAELPMTSFFMVAMIDTSLVFLKLVANSIAWYRHAQKYVALFNKWRKQLSALCNDILRKMVWFQFHLC